MPGDAQLDTQLDAQLLEDPAERGLRADARRNRRKVLDAAHARFAEHGLDAQIDLIARDAGVGVGTVYRHFPTKGALLEALAVDQVRRLTHWAHQALAADDAGAAFGAYLHRVGQLYATDRLLADVVSSGPDAFPRVRPALQALNAATDELLRRAQAAGAVRPDARGVDVAALMCGLGRAAGAFGEQLSAQRYVQIVLAGLRAQPSN
jgi:AcrR family transcriptional regulator